MALHSRIRGIRKRWSRIEAQTMAEYAVILGVITVAIVLALGALSTAIQNGLAAVAGAM